MWLPSSVHSVIERAAGWHDQPPCIRRFRSKREEELDSVRTFCQTLLLMRAKIWPTAPQSIEGSCRRMCSRVLQARHGFWCCCLYTS